MEEAKQTTGLQAESFTQFVERHAPNDPRMANLIAFYTNAGGTEAFGHSLVGFLLQCMFQIPDLLADYTKAYPNRVPYMIPKEEYVPTEEEVEMSRTIHGFIANMNFAILKVHPTFIANRCSVGTLTLRHKYNMKKYTLTLELRKAGEHVVTLTATGAEECAYICRLVTERFCTEK